MITRVQPFGDTFDAKRSRAVYSLEEQLEDCPDQLRLHRVDCQFLLHACAAPLRLAARTGDGIAAGGALIALDVAGGTAGQPEPVAAPEAAAAAP